MLGDLWVLSVASSSSEGTESDELTEGLSPELEELNTEEEAKNEVRYRQQNSAGDVFTWEKIKGAEQEGLCAHSAVIVPSHSHPSYKLMIFGGFNGEGVSNRLSTCIISKSISSSPSRSFSLASPWREEYEEEKEGEVCPGTASKIPRFGHAMVLVEGSRRAILITGGIGVPSAASGTNHGSNVTSIFYL